MGTTEVSAEFVRPMGFWAELFFEKLLPRLNDPKDLVFSENGPNTKTLIWIFKNYAKYPVVQQELLICAQNTQRLPEIRAAAINALGHTVSGNAELQEVIGALLHEHSPEHVVVGLAAINALVPSIENPEVMKEIGDCIGRSHPELSNRASQVLTTAARQSQQSHQQILDYITDPRNRHAWHHSTVREWLCEIAINQEEYLKNKIQIINVLLYLLPNNEHVQNCLLTVIENTETNDYSPECQLIQNIIGNFSGIAYSKPNIYKRLQQIAARHRVQYVKNDINSTLKSVDLEKNKNDLCRNANNADLCLSNRQTAISKLLQYLPQDYSLQLKILEIAENEEEIFDLRVAIIKGFQGVENLEPNAYTKLHMIANKATDSLVKESAIETITSIDQNKNSHERWLETATYKGNPPGLRCAAITALLQKTPQDFPLQETLLRIAEDTQDDRYVRQTIIQGFQAVGNLAPDADKTLRIIAAEATDTVVKQAAQDYLARKLTAERGR
jgi:hypothetical protein